VHNKKDVDANLLTGNIDRRKYHLCSTQFSWRIFMQSKITMRIETVRLISHILCSALLVLALMFTQVQSAFANSDGRWTRRTVLNTAGCSGSACHSNGMPNSAVRISVFAESRRVSDSVVIAPGSRVRLTIMVAHSNAAAGVNVAVRAGLTGEVSVGSVTALDNSLTVRGTVNTELTHTQPKVKAQGDTAVTFSFDWQAPTTTGTYFLRAISNSVNNNRVADTEDTWNWLQPVRLVVARTVSVRSDAEDTDEQFSIAPNPMSEASVFMWNLPTSGFATGVNQEYTIRLVNSTGAELRSWQGVAGAGGRVVVPFDRRDRNGIDLPSGQYFAILETRKRKFLRTVAVIR
jgi:hypothetical protein